MLEGSIAFTLSGATNSKFKALFSVWLPDYQVIFKSMRVADDTFKSFSECEWVNVQYKSLANPTTRS